MLQKHGGNIINFTATLHYKGQVMQCHAGSAKSAIGICFFYKYTLYKINYNLYKLMF